MISCITVLVNVSYSVSNSRKSKFAQSRDEFQAARKRLIKGKGKVDKSLIIFEK